MNTVNFNQIICKNISENGEDISGVFDTLVCERGKNRFFIYVLFTQIIEPSTGSFDKYYYRIILRYLGKNRSEMKHYRVDSGIFWDDIDNITDGITDDIVSSQSTRYSTTRPGYSGRLSIDYFFNVDVQGNYEMDLYVKALENTDTLDTCEQLSVKDLKLVSISPFQIIFQNK